MLTQQKTALYESNIIKTNNQIEKMSTIKHDMANNLICIKKFILDGNYDEACKMYLLKIKKIFKYARYCICLNVLYMKRKFWSL